MGTLKRWFLDIIFPRRCLGCEILLFNNGESHICLVCLAGIKIKNDFACAFCGSPVAAGTICPFCRISHFLDRLFVATSYENPLVEKIIKTMKYRFVKSLADDMAKPMTKYLERRFLLGLNLDHGSTVVVPVPLHRRRLNWRGFNQAEIIGRRISENLGFNYIADALTRVRANKPQTEMPDRDSRIKSAKNLFKYSPACESLTSTAVSIVGKNILLIDDISTTGSTLDDCARALKGAGAKEVIGFVFAKGTLASDKKLLQ